MRNEEKHLPHLAKSLEDFLKRGGEWISLDTGSTDDSIKVAESLGCKVTSVEDMFRVVINRGTANKINKKFITSGEEVIVKKGDSLFDYSAARNYIASLSSNDICAMPDCDEIYTKLDIDKINSVITSGTEQLEYNFVFSHDEQGNPMIQFMHCKFYDRRKLTWTGIIHEILTGSANKVYLPEDIIKLEHYQNVETNRNGYLTGLALDCYTNPDNDRNVHYFARELMYKGRFRSAIKQFEIHIAMNKWVEEAGQSMIFIGDCHYHLQDTDETFKWYIKALDLCSTRREPFMKLAEHYYRKNSPAHVIMYAQAALTIDQISFYSNYQPYYENLPHELLYWAYWYTGDKEKSKYHYDKACSYQPNNPKYLAERHFYYSELQFTGERMVPGKTDHRPDIVTEHIQRYNFAAQFTKGLKVLDAACGEGYAKEILKAKQYIGLDIDHEVVKHALEKYGFGYFQEDLEKGIPRGEKVDMVVSFETIEHLADPHPFLQWVKDNSKTFIFSIPVNMPSEFHKQVYSINQIKELIHSYFPDTIFLAQNDTIQPLIEDAKYVVGVSFAEDLPEVSIIIPTLGRESGLQKCLDSIGKLYYPKSKIEVIVIEDSPHLGVPARVREGVERSTGSFIVFGSNDIELAPESLLIAIHEKKSFLAFNTGSVLEDEGNICEHFMIQRDLIPSLEKGEIFCTEFHHVGVDNYLWAQMKKLGLAYRSERAIIKHNHFTRGAEFDDVYKLGWSTVEEDRQLLAKKLELLEL